jgi:hypothetical protein
MKTLLIAVSSILSLNATELSYTEIKFINLNLFSAYSNIQMIYNFNSNRDYKSVDTYLTILSQNLKLTEKSLENLSSSLADEELHENSLWLERLKSISSDMLLLNIYLKTYIKSNKQSDKVKFIKYNREFNKKYIEFIQTQIDKAKNIDD